MSLAQVFRSVFVGSESASSDRNVKVRLGVETLGERTLPDASPIDPPADPTAGEQPHADTSEATEVAEAGGTSTLNDFLAELNALQQQYNALQAQITLQQSNVDAAVNTLCSDTFLVDDLYSAAEKAKGAYEGYFQAFPNTPNTDPTKLGFYNAMFAARDAYATQNGKVQADQANVDAQTATLTNLTNQAQTLATQIANLQQTVTALQLLQLRLYPFSN